MPAQSNERRFNFTEAAVAALPPAPQGKRLMYYDASVKNLALRVRSQRGYANTIYSLSTYDLDIRLSKVTG
ncbi:MAG: hypothetical protein IJ517_03750 [Alphaproteobacteria bacterium]|nr:hypothetical protein [Alphaproteobacteria bacterium]